MYLILSLLCLVLGSWSASTCETSFPCPAHCTCHLEINLASCSSSNLTILPSTMPSCTEHLNMSFNQLATIQSQAFWSTRRLRTLLLNDNRIDTIVDGAFSPLEALVKLDLSRNQISTLTRGFSLGLGSLRELSLAENQLTSLDGGCFYHMDALQKLNLSCNNIGFVRIFGSLSTLRRLYLDGNNIDSLSNGDFSMLRNLEVLGIQRNNLSNLEVGALAPLTSLTVLDVGDNHLNVADFKAFLSLRSHSTHIRLVGNNFTCDCDLQRVFRKLRSVQRILLEDYDGLTCVGPEELRGEALREVDTQLCFAETVTVLIITITVLITVVAAIVMAEKNRKKNQKEKHWTEVSDLSCDSQN